MIPPQRIALVFDMDNTLLKSRIDFLAIRRDLGALLRAGGGGEEAEEDLRLQPIAEILARGAAHDRVHGTSLVPRMWQIVAAHEVRGLQDAVPTEDAPQVLAALRGRGYRIAVLTNTGRASALRALASAGLSGCVDTVLTREDVHALKPAGDGVAEAIRRLAPIDRAYVIGDSWIDGAAAAAGGARFIAYRRPEEELQARGVRPWSVITALEELLAVRFDG